MISLKKTLYLFAFATPLFSCSKTDSTTSTADSLKTGKTAPDSAITLAAGSSDIYFADSLFADLHPVFTTIPKEKFEKLDSIVECGTGVFMRKTDLYTKSQCDEICQTFLIEKKTGKKLVLPCSYDAGILGLIASPSCDKFIIYSSYDSGDYKQYYDHGAELFGFAVTKEDGLQAIKPLFKYYFNDHLLNNVTWIDDQSIALDVYIIDTTDATRKNYMITKLKW